VKIQIDLHIDEAATPTFEKRNLYYYLLLLTMQFVRDFLFTDINNHLEFFQYIQNLDTDDHVLMISLLERLVNHNQPLTTVSPFDNSSPAIRYQAFSHCPSSRLLLNAAAPPSGYGSTNDAPGSNNGASHINIDKRKLLGRTVSTVLPQPENIKKPLRIAKGYAALLNLHDHQYNVYEYAYLISSVPSSNDVSKRTSFMAIFAFVSQVVFFFALSQYNIMSLQVTIDPTESYFLWIVFIMIASSAMFGHTLMNQFHDATNFNTSMTFLREEQAAEIERMERDMSTKHSPSTYTYARTLNGPKIYLMMNILINKFLGMAIFIFNVYFIMTASDPTSASYNAVLLTFIIEIDEIFKPNWSDSKVQNLLAEILMDYCLAKALLENSNETTTAGEQEGIHVERRGPALQVEVAKFYIELFPGFWSDYDLEEIEDDFGTSIGSGGLSFRNSEPGGKVNDGRFSVVVYSSAEDEVSNTTISYNRTVYNVKGSRAGELYEAFSTFHCLRNFRETLVEVPSRT